MRGSLSRRSLLRGFGASLALPFLDAMVPACGGIKNATGNGSSPLRMIFLGLEGGIFAGDDGFFPWKEGLDADRNNEWGKKGILPGGAVADVGPDYKLTSTLEPLAAFRQDVTLLSGLHHRNDKIPNSVVNAHGQDLGTLLTGVNISGTPGVAIQNGISFDQVVARHIGLETRLPSLEIAANGSSYNTKEATGLGYMGFLSYDADGYAMPVEGNAQALFDRLFTDGGPKQKAEREATHRRNQSILDAVLEDMHRIEKQVSVGDRRKLDEYFATVRELERRLDRGRAWADKPVQLPPGVSRPDAGNGNAFGGDGSGRVDQMRVMLDMLAVAMQTDVTRVATMRLGGYFGNFSFLGFREDPHGVYAHNNGDPEKIKGARAIDRMHVEQLAYFLGRLKSVEESDGTLLDNSIVFYGAGLTNGPNGRVTKGEIGHDAHGQFNTPILLAGHGRGAINAGQHINYDHGTPLSNLFQTLGEIAGLPDPKFADSDGTLPGLA